jgi:polyadenylate-binding protein
MISESTKVKESQSQEFVLHVSDIPLDVKESEIIDYFKKDYSTTEFKILSIKRHFRNDIPTQWAHILVDKKESFTSICEKHRFPVFKSSNKIQSRVLPEIKDKAQLRDNASNLVVRKLNKDKVDNSDLYAYFSKFGEVVCCKVSKTLQGDATFVKQISNGYGYVKFRDEAQALAAAKSLNQSDFSGEKIIVERFDKDKKLNSNTNIYVKDFPSSWNEAQLKAYFSDCGDMGSVVIMKDEAGKSKGFGFVCFRTGE